MLNERLRLAKQLLKDDGVIFVSIDDNEQVLISHTRIKITLMVIICMIINAILLFLLYDVWKVLINIITYLPLIYAIYKITTDNIKNYFKENN